MEELLNYEKNMESVIKTLRDTNQQSLQNTEDRLNHKLDGQAVFMNRIEKDM